jgi:hypothetical protein
MVPEWLHDYKADKTDFDKMPPQCPWDHKIKLEEGTKPWDNVCLIPLSDNETDTLDQFLNKNLQKLKNTRKQISMGFTILLHKEEGWKTPTSTGLLMA